ncbi:unnamed protein product [Allacma fusca]|uniref:Uncharacterized protein n=1 Tax=Allacma fusca TaxID=39272 RepID=A0A8J2KFP7_9HEXA|nr:unnamed protein product [Allacma fusca]
MDKFRLMPLSRMRNALNTKARATAIAGVRGIQNASMDRLDASVSSNVDTTEEFGSRSVTKKPIEIPVRIERGPTDILKALAGTVGRDYTAPHYKFHDDPYLIPTSNMTKRMYALSKESGRKAAKWIRQQHPELYYHKNADPPAMAFLPDPTLENVFELTEETIQSFINLGLVTEAMKAYDALKDKGADLSPGIKQALLETVAFYNGEEPSDDDLLDERWYEQQQRERNRNVWQKSGFAEQLFQDLAPQDSRAYSALISGLAKYRDCDKAFALYQEASSKGLKLDTPTFNALISIVNYVRENTDLRMQLLEELLMNMKEQNLQPDIGTLNASLNTAGFIGNFKIGKTLMLQVLTEFKGAGVNPSLGSYNEIITTYCRDKGPISTILVDIMNEIEGKEYEIQHPSDISFFVNAMEVCRNHLQDLDLAKRVHQLLMTGHNYDFIGDSLKESFYYRHFTILRVNLEPIEDFFNFYDKLVPNIYIPEPAVMEEILKVVELNGAINYIPQLFSDIVMFDFTNRESLMTLMLQILNGEFPSRSTDQSVKLGNALGAIAWKIYLILENQREDYTKVIYWTGKMLGDLMSVLVKSEALDQACQVMKKLVTPNQKVVGAVPLDSLTLFLQAAMQSKNSAMCLACLQYTSDAGYPEASKMAEEIVRKVELDSVQKGRVNNIAGFDVSAKLDENVNA